MSDQLLEVRGESMRNTFPSGTKITVEIAESKYFVGDIVVFRMNGDLVIKRVVACPGDNFQDFESKSPILKSFSEQWNGVLPDGEYIIQGDIPGSMDSLRVGPINKTNILGRVVKSYA